MIRAYADAVMSKEQCKYMYELIQAYAESDTDCSSKVQWKCKSVPLKIGNAKTSGICPNSGFRGEETESLTG